MNQKRQFFLPLLIMTFFSPKILAEDLTLRLALSEAAKNSPRLQKAESFYDESSWKKVEALSGFLPTVTGSATYMPQHKYLLTDINLGAGPASVPAIIPTSNFYLTAQLPLFDGFANINRYKSASSLERSAKNDWDWTRFQIDREVTLQFYKALGAQVLKDVAEQNVKTLADHLSDVTLFKKAGVATKFEVLRVEVQVSEAKSELLNSVDNVEISKNKLGEILGLEAEPRKLRGTLPVLKPELVRSVDLQNISKRKDILAIQDKVIATNQLDSAAGKFWVPKINLYGQYQYYNNRTDDIGDSANYRDAYQLGLSLTWNLFDGMSSIARSNQSGEQLYQSQKTLQIAKIKARQDFDMWKRKFSYFSSVYQARLNDVEKATESVRLAREGRKVGSRTNTDLLDAENELFRAKAGLVNSQVGSIEALINLELSSGQKLYDF